MFSRKLLYSSECANCGYRRENTEKRLLHRCPQCSKPYLKHNMRRHNLRKKVLFSISQKKEMSERVVMCSLLIGTAIYTGTVSNSGRDSSVDSDPFLYWGSILMYSTIGLLALYFTVRNWLKVRRLKKELGNSDEIDD